MLNLFKVRWILIDLLISAGKKSFWKRFQWYCSGVVIAVVWTSVNSLSYTGKFLSIYWKINIVSWYSWDVPDIVLRRQNFYYWQHIWSTLQLKLWPKTAHFYMKSWPDQKFAFFKTFKVHVKSKLMWRFTLLVHISVVTVH